MSINIKSDNDPLLQDVIDYVQETGVSSVAALQRRFQIGFNRACGLKEKLIELGLCTDLEPVLTTPHPEKGWDEQSPAIIKIALLDSIAQSHFEALSTLGVECICFTPNTTPEELGADLLFLVGNFDDEATQQAGDFCRKCANQFALSVQLGQQRAVWADSCLELAERQMPAASIAEILAMFSATHMVSVDLDDLINICAGKICCIRSVQATGAERVELCQKALLAQLPKEMAPQGILLLLKGRDIELSETHDIVSFVLDEYEEEIPLIFGCNFDELEGNPLSISMILSYE